MTQPDPFAAVLESWKKATDDYLATWSKTFEQLSGNEQAAAAQREATKTFLGAQSAMAGAARQVYGPMVEAAGGVPLGEFRRLMDQVHTILLRLDRIDDALYALAPGGSSKAPAPAAKRRKPAKKDA
ncbi:MAG: hypothetical protein ACR2HN_13345 [Tepidiformaceae bacterium]